MNTGYNTIASSDIGKIDPDAQATVGAISSTGDSRLFRYVKFANTSNILAGAKVYSQPTTNDVSITPVGTGGQKAQALVAGSKSFVVKLATKIDQGKFDGGFVHVEASNGDYDLRVKSVAAGIAGANVRVVLEDFIPDGLDLDTATKITFSSNPYVAVVSTPTTGSITLGVAVNAIAGNEPGNSVYAYVRTSEFTVQS